MGLKSVGGGGGGAPGPTGPIGPANTLQIGSVTTGSAGSNASASITGSAPNQTLNITIPRGDQGTQGIQGVQGNPGNNGATGTNGLGWSARAIKTSDQLAIGTAYATITGLDLALLAGSSYQFEFWILADADATTTGIDVSVTGPASPTQIQYETEVYTSATAKAWSTQTAYDANTANANSAGASQRFYRVTGVIRNGVNAGNLSPRIKREAVGTGPNVRAGSFGLLVALT